MIYVYGVVPAFMTVHRQLRYSRVACWQRVPPARKDQYSLSLHFYWWESFGLHGCSKREWRFRGKFLIIKRLFVLHIRQCRADAV